MKRLFWIVHNVIAHPLMVVWPRVGERLHEWTGRRMVQTAANLKKSGSAKDVVALAPKLYEGARQEILGLLADLDEFAEEHGFRTR